MFSNSSDTYTGITQWWEANHLQLYFLAEVIILKHLKLTCSSLQDTKLHFNILNIHTLAEKGGFGSSCCIC